MSNDIHYIIERDNGEQHQINVELDKDHSLIINDNFNPPEWAKLDHHQCSHCTLKIEESPFCPIAKNIAFLFAGSSFGDSFENVKLEVSTAHRSYTSETTLQRALSSLFGLVCSLSPCPYTIPLKPMGRFHLPLSSEHETLVRATSFFLLKKYLEHLEDNTVPINLDHMVDAYQNLKELNKCFVKRFREIDQSDATVNALILLDVLAKDINFELEEHLNMLKTFFGIDGFYEEELILS